MWTISPQGRLLPWERLSGVEHQGVPQLGHSPAFCRSSLAFCPASTWADKQRQHQCHQLRTSPLALCSSSDSILPPECSGSMSFSFILLILFRDGVSPGDSGLLGLVCTDFIPHHGAGPHDRAQNGCRRHLAVTQLSWCGTNWLGNSWASVCFGTLVQEAKINGVLKTKRLRVKLTQESLN